MARWGAPGDADMTKRECKGFPACGAATFSEARHEGRCRKKIERMKIGKRNDVNRGNDKVRSTAEQKSQRRGHL